MTAPAFNGAQPCRRTGCWPKGSPQWATGEIVAFSAASATIHTDTGMDLPLPAERFQWRAKGGYWAVFSDVVVARVRQVEAHEKKADAMGTGRLRPTPAVGDYVVIHHGERRAGGFVVSMEGPKMVVLAGGRRHRYRPDMIFWDDAREVWCASGVLKEAPDA